MSAALATAQRGERHRKSEQVWAPGERHRQAEQAWAATCLSHESQRGSGGGVNRLGQITLDCMDRAIAADAITPGQFALMVVRGSLGLPGNASAQDYADWHSAIDALECEMAKPPRENFYSVPGKPFVNAAEAWFWAMDCIEQQADGARIGNLLSGRPCDPDDVVLAVNRLNVPPVHQRTMLAWGKKREAPPAGSAAASLWDEVMKLLTTALQAKGIVQAEPMTVFELMDLPLTYRWLLYGEPVTPSVDSAGEAAEA
jgi:hypothetical protein